MKPRTHNEWFRPVSLGNRKSCPKCKKKLLPNESIWSLGEYRYARWRTVTHFCRECWPEIAEHLTEHTAECGCSVELKVQGVRPSWLSLTCTGSEHATT